MTTFGILAALIGVPLLIVGAWAIERWYRHTPEKDWPPFGRQDEDEI